MFKYILVWWDNFLLAYTQLVALLVGHTICDLRSQNSDFKSAQERLRDITVPLLPL